MRKFVMFGLALLAFAVLAAVPDVMAQQSSNVGSTFLDDVTGIISGNLGTLLGLGISLFGLWMWLVQQSSWGLIILIAGAALTAFPGIYGSISSGFQDAFQATQEDVRSGQNANGS